VIPVAFPGVGDAKPRVRREMATVSARRALGNRTARLKGDKSPVDFPRARPGRSCCRRRNRRRAQRSDQPQDVGEQTARDGDFGHLESDVATVTDDFRTDLDELLPQARERPILDPLRRYERAQEVPKIIRQRM